MQTSKTPFERISINAVSALTDIPVVTVAIPNPAQTWGQKVKRLFGQHPEEIEYEIHALKVGTVQRISALALTIPQTLVAAISNKVAGEALNEFLPQFDAHSETLVMIVALALTNREEMPSEALKASIRREFTVPLMAQVIRATSYQFHLPDFLASISLISDQSALPRESRA